MIINSISKILKTINAYELALNAKACSPHVPATPGKCSCLGNAKCGSVKVYFEESTSVFIVEISSKLTYSIIYFECVEDYSIITMFTAKHPKQRKP